MNENMTPTEHFDAITTEIGHVDCHSEWSTVTVDGVEYEYRAVPDDGTSIHDDGDWYGALEYVGRGRESRPASFNGAACKVQTHYGDTYWWQPPTDVDDEGLKVLKRHIVGILEFGYSVVEVQGDGRYESLCGVAAVDTEAQDDAVCELIFGMERERLADRATWADCFV